MTTSNYTRKISEYIIERVEENTEMASVKFNFRSVNINGEYIFVFEEFDEKGELCTFKKFTCPTIEETKEEAFYSALNYTLIQYFLTNDSLLYSALTVNGGKNEKFNMFTNTGVSIGIDINDEIDERECLKFKAKLDQPSVESSLVETEPVAAKKLKKVPELVVI